ncbi:MAG: response regulator [Syntrophaceae bacterium]|nr:response regulator [Syntrophaceae bacterium]
MAKRMAKKKILVIDDMPNVVTMLKARLEASGYEVIAAFDGQQGLAHAYAEKPDLIILDIVMPAGGGYSVYSRLKMSPKTRSVPVIFLTAKDRPEDVARAYKLGAQYYVKKPYKPEMLLETVKKVLEPSVHPEQPRGLRKRIMVIAEDPEITELEKLGEMGYDVTIVSSIKEGSDEARKESPDVIIVDGALVKANNYDGFYQLKLEFALTKIPIIISVTKEESEEFQKRLGDFSSYCLKPFNTIDLLGRIRVALQKD